MSTPLRELIAQMEAVTATITPRGRLNEIIDGWIVAVRALAALDAQGPAPSETYCPFCDADIPRSDGVMHVCRWHRRNAPDGEAVPGPAEAPAGGAEPPALKDAAEMLWIVLANVSGGDWTQQSPEWQEAAARGRDTYCAAVKQSALTGGAAPSWPNPDLSVHARTLRDAVARLRRDFREIAEHLDPVLDVADSLDMLARPIRVLAGGAAPAPAVERDLFLIQQAQPHVCSLLCPSTRRADEPGWKHHYLCEAMTERVRLAAAAGAVSPSAPVVHGQTCPKAPHGPAGGYLHLAGDDTPYDVDGVTYCGRCHQFLAGAVSSAPKPEGKE